AVAEQRAIGTRRNWQEPFVKYRLPTIYNLRRDPFERADFNSNTYWDWMVDHAPQLYLAQWVVSQQIANFVKSPPRQKAASFALDEVMRQLDAAADAKKLAAARAAATKPAAAREQEPAL